jgi:hypothetical protein
MEIPHVYLAPESDARIQAPPGLVVKYILPQALSLPALQDARAVVYQLDGAALRNVTAQYRATAESLWKPETPRFINLGDTAFAEYASPGWDGMLRRVATVRVGGPRAPDERLYIGVFRTTDFQLGVRVNGVDLPAPVIERSGELTQLTVPLPAALMGRPEIEVTLANGNREPLKFGFVEIR